MAPANKLPVHQFLEQYGLDFSVDFHVVFIALLLAAVVGSVLYELIIGTKIRPGRDKNKKR
jgi:uncharacterized integral membrane protein